MENTKQQSSNPQIYKFANKKVIMSILLGIGFLSIGLITLFPMIIAVGVLFFVQAAIFKSLEAIRIYPTHSEIKLIMFGGHFYLQHSKISKVELVKDKVLRITFDNDGKDKVFKLPLSEFTEEDKPEIKDFYLNQVLTQNQSKAQ